MFTSNKQLTQRISVLANVTVVALVFLGIFTGMNWNIMPDGLVGFLALRVTVKNMIVSGIFLAGCASAFCVFGLTNMSLAAPFWKELVRVTKACTVAVIVALLFPYTSRSGTFNNHVVLYFLPISIVACLCGRLVAHYCTKRLFTSFNGRRDLIIVGSGPLAANLYSRIREEGHRDFSVLGFVDSPHSQVVAAEIRPRMLGRLSELEMILMKCSVDEVLIALPARSCYAQIQSAIKTCERAGVEAKLDLSDLFQVSIARPELDVEHNSPFVSMKVVRDDYRLLIKRCIDMVGAIVGLAVFGPLMLLIILAIKLTSPGPAVFTQDRYGFHKRMFRMYKFRTMVQNAESLQANLESRNEAQGPVFKIRNDPRVTLVGRFLRKTSLDELPQFFNVLLGEMSIVGPRPLPMRDVSRFDDASLMRRFSVKPGLTCLWQVSGRSNNGFDHWITEDLRYIDNWSLTLDAKIILKTVPAAIKGTGAY